MRPITEVMNVPCGPQGETLAHPGLVEHNILAYDRFTENNAKFAHHGLVRRVSSYDGFPESSADSNAYMTSVVTALLVLVVGWFVKGQVLRGRPTADDTAAGLCFLDIFLCDRLWFRRLEAVKPEPATIIPCIMSYCRR